ncbi:MAG: hypothetical protein ACC656_03285 [Candidatus Heimdallarchaeota archaeon]
MTIVPNEKIVEQLINTLKEKPRLREMLLDQLQPSTFVHRDELTVLLEEIKQLRIDTNKRFEELINSTNKRFEELINSTNKRFEELINSMNKRFEAVDKRFEVVDKKFQDQIEEIRVISAGIGTLGNRSGHEFESFMLSIFVKILKKNGIDFKKIEKIGIRNNDPNLLNGVRKFSFDGYIENEKKILLEVKFSTDIGKINWFYERSLAFEKIKKIKPDLWILTISIDEDALEYAEELGIKVFTREGKVSISY